MRPSTKWTNACPSPTSSVCPTCTKRSASACCADRRRPSGDMPDRSPCVRPPSSLRPITGGRRDTNMRVPGWTALAVAVAACQSAAAMSRDETTVAGVTVFTVGEHDDMVEAELEIEAALDDGKRVALTGSPSLLAVLKPDDVYAWPATNTVVLDPAAGIGIFGFDATDSVHRAALLEAWRWGG